MRAHRLTHYIAAAVIATGCLSASSASAQVNGRDRNDNRQIQRNRDDYNRGYQQGLREGEQDARRNRTYQPGGANNNRRADNRRNDDIDFRNGFSDGYRDGYYQVRGDVRNDRNSGILLPRDDRRDDRRDGGTLRRTPGGYQEPASARGYSDGYEAGLKDARNRDRYDPVGEKDYRSGDKGYYGSYGSRDAYKNNYRAGFRQGYEDGYREDGIRRR